MSSKGTEPAFNHQFGKAMRTGQGFGVRAIFPIMGATNIPDR